MTALKVKCPPSHARVLARQADAAGLIEMSVALDVLADDLEQAWAALSEARPYVAGRVFPPGHPERDWRAETAEEILARVDAALGRCS